MTKKYLNIYNYEIEVEMEPRRIYSKHNNLEYDNFTINRNVILTLEGEEMHMSSKENEPVSIEMAVKSRKELLRYINNYVDDDIKIEFIGHTKILVSPVEYKYLNGDDRDYEYLKMLEWFDR